MRMMLWAVLATLISGLSLIGPAPTRAQETEPVDPQRTVDLAAGFNGFTYGGAEAVAPEAVMGGLVDADALLAIFRFDAETQSFAVWRPGTPFLNTLDSVAPLDALFLHLAHATAWSGPAPAFDAGELPLVAGFNLVPALQSDGASPGSTFSDGVEAVFHLDPSSQSYDSFRPGGLAALNTLEALPRFSAIWVLSTGDGTLPYEPFSGAPSVGEAQPLAQGPDGLSSVVLRGATWSGEPSVSVGGVLATSHLLCEGTAIVATLETPTTAETIAVDLRSDGATARTTLDLPAVDSEALALSVTAARQLVEECISDPTEREALLAHLDAASAKIEAGDIEGAFDDLAAFLTAIAEAESLSAAEQDAFSDIGESLVEAVGAIVPSLFDQIADLFGALIPIGIFF